MTLGKVLLIQLPRLLAREALRQEVNERANLGRQVPTAGINRSDRVLRQSVTRKEPHESTRPHLR